MYSYQIEDREKINTLIGQFLKNHENELSDTIKEKIAKQIKENEPISNSFFLQLCEILGLIKPAYSVYYQMREVIRKNFNLQRDIIEIDNGIFPLLGHYLSETQLKLGKGTVTVYDSNVWKKYPTRAQLINSQFTMQTQIPKDSLLVGMFPSDSTDIIIEKALKEKLEFCVALDGGKPSSFPTLTPERYEEMLIEELKIELSNTQTFKIWHFPSSCLEREKSQHPVLIVKNKKVLFPFKMR